jgi:hypothetical protein
MAAEPAQPAQELALWYVQMFAAVGDSLYCHVGVNGQGLVVGSSVFFQRL